MSFEGTDASSLAGTAADVTLSAWSWLAFVVKVIAYISSHSYWCLILAILLLAVWLLREKWARACWTATLGQVTCPDPRNYHVCCVPCGWCIMNAWCPFLCPKYHPTFRLRAIIVKARRLPAGAATVAKGHMPVYAEVHAGSNPVKTTSTQRYGIHRGPLSRGTNTVWWNEPVDVVMQPADTQIGIRLYRKDGVLEELVGSVTVPMDAIYEPPGVCDECLSGDSLRARLCSELCGVESRWPFVRGAPSREERLVRPGVGACCRPADPADERLATSRGHGVLLQEHEDEELGPPRQQPMATGMEQAKFDAMCAVTRDGLQLGSAAAEFQSDKDVVLAAVRQNGRAIRLAPEHLQHDLQVQRVAARVPRPLTLQLAHKGEEAGLLWVYFVLHGMGEDEGLPSHMTALLED